MGSATSMGIDIGANVLDSGLSALGMKGAEVTGGLSDAIGVVSDLPLELIPGVGTALKAGFKGLSLADKYFGSSS